MTKGDVFVNVRRGRTAYGPLCVFQRNIVIDNPEKFGLPETTKENKFYVTQVFTSQESQTNKFDRKPVQYRDNNKLSDEEKSMCTIFHKFNNSVIASMQDEAYRDVMADFWTEKISNRLPGTTMNTTKWDLSNMVALMKVMFATANNIIFEKASSKVACPQRLVRLSSLLLQYAKYFQERKCLPDGTFVKIYEERIKKKMVDLGSFTGMLAEYTASPSGPKYDTTKKSEVTRMDQATIDLVAKMNLPPAYNAGWNSGGGLAVMQTKSNDTTNQAATLKLQLELQEQERRV